MMAVGVEERHSSGGLNGKSRATHYFFTLTPCSSFFFKRSDYEDEQTHISSLIRTGP